MTGIFYWYKTQIQLTIELLITIYKKESLFSKLVYDLEKIACYTISKAFVDYARVMHITGTQR